MVLHDAGTDHVASYHIREPTQRRLTLALSFNYGDI